MKDISVLGIDLDDVTADLSRVVLEYYNFENNKNITELDLNSWHGNWELMRKYYLTSSIYGELPVIGGAQDVLAELNEKYHVVFITASPNIDSTMEKLNWVDRNFPFIGSENVFVTKNKYLINADVLFDDSPEFLPKFRGYRVLMDKIYNGHLDLNTDYDYKVRNWFEFKNVIEELEYTNKLFSK